MSNVSTRKLTNWRDLADALTDLNLCCTHMPSCTLCWIPAQISLTFLHHTSLSDGEVGGSCAGSIVCLDGQSSCIGNICACNAGYSDVDGECNEGVYFEIFVLFICSKTCFKRPPQTYTKTKILICLLCCFTSQVNSYGHGETVSSPNHTFS